MGRARSKNPKSHQHCLRLTDRQEELLKQYADFREFDSEMDAIRAMIDGLEDWFRRQQAKERAAVTSVRPGRETADSGPVAIIDVPIGDGKAIDVDTSVGDFGGRPSVGLPESRHDGLE